MTGVGNVSRGAARKAVRRVLTTLLANPVVQRIKAPLRDAWWAVKGRGTDNPPLPPHVTSMLFVCLGNICRSPFGAELARRLVAEAGRGDIRCTSAGIRPSQDGRSPDEACRVSEAYGVTLVAHRPQALTPELMDANDMVIVMEWRQLAHLREAYPRHRDRIFLLSLFDDEARNAYERYNIADPFGRPAAAFEECYRRVERALRRCLARSQAW